MTRWIFIAAYAVAVATGTVAAVAPAHAADAEGAPRLALSAPSVTPDGSLIVTGEGFPANTSAQVVICGNLALAGSADCDMPHARVAGTDSQGHFATEMTVALPPSPCPCVVQASSLALPSAVTTPVDLTGAKAVQPRGVVPAQATALKARATLEGSGPTSAWFGAQPHRTLIVDVTNPGTAPISSPVFQLTVGKGDNPKNATDAPDLGVLAPGETKTYKIPVTLDAFAVGSYTVRGVIKGDGEPVTFKASTGTFPWGLLASALIVIQLVLLAVRDRARRRLVPVSVVAPASPSMAITGDTALRPSAEAPVPALTRVTVGAPRRAEAAVVVPPTPIQSAAPRTRGDAEELLAHIGLEPMEPLPTIDPLAYWASPLLTPRAIDRGRSNIGRPATTIQDPTAHQPAPDQAFLRLALEPMRALSTIDPLAYWASPLLTPRAVRRAYLHSVREAS